MRYVEKVLVRLGWFGIFILGISVQVPLPCYADDIYTIVVKKQDDKEKYRWNLADWLATRDRMRLQDLWLAIHSPSPYEFAFDGNYQLDQVTGGDTFNAWEVGAAAFASILGLEGRYHSGLNQQVFGIFDIRLLGYHDQGTHLTAQVGLRNTVTGAAVSYRNALAGARMSLYFTRQFGLEGLYQHYFSSTSNSAGVNFTGDRLQGGVFLDFRFIRIYGDYFDDSETQSDLSGFIAGAKFYF